MSEVRDERARRYVWPGGGDPSEQPSHGCFSPPYPLAPAAQSVASAAVARSALSGRSELPVVTLAH